MMTKNHRQQGHVEKTGNATIHTRFLVCVKTVAQERKRN
jgi:hypothetical protein